jgi:hypothetical protein
MPDQVRQFGLSKPVMPTDLRRIGPDRFRDDDLMQTKPIRADHTLAQELEQETRTGMNTKFLRQLPRSSILIRLGHIHRASEHPVDLSRETSVIVRTSVDKEPPRTVAAHDRRYAMQPPLTNRLPPPHNSQHLVTLVNPLNQITHGAHDDRGHRHALQRTHPARHHRLTTSRSVQPLMGGEDLLTNERRIRRQAVAIANCSGADDQGLPERPALSTLPGRLVYP